MIPLGDVVPRRTRPVVTVATAGLLLLSLLLFALTLDPQQRWGALWTLGASRSTVPWPALLTSFWLEPSWSLGLANSAALLLYGPAVEDRLGPHRMAALLGTGAATNALIGLFAVQPPSTPVTGAAVAVAAVLGTYLSLHPGSKLVFWVPGTAGTSLHEVPVFWGVSSWLIVAAGRLINVHAGWIVGAPMIAVIAAVLIAFAAGRHLALPARRSFGWWDDAAA